MLVEEQSCNKRTLIKFIIIIYNADRMSFWTLIKTVSVECLSLYTDCSGSNMLLFIKCSLSLHDITFSMTFEINVKFDTGRYFSRYRYLNQFSGRMRAVLSDLGIVDS